MELFTFESDTEIIEQDMSPTGPISTGGEAQMKLSQILRRRKKNVTLPEGELSIQYQERIDEIFAIINARKQDESGRIKVDKVTVKLGVEAGGKIGLFVEGRLDVAFAFEVEFKLAD